MQNGLLFLNFTLNDKSWDGFREKMYKRDHFCEQSKTARDGDEWAERAMSYATQRSYDNQTNGSSSGLQEKERKN